MKLNSDCIREIMLEIEKSLSVSIVSNKFIQMDDLSLNDLCKSLPDYTKEDIFYALFNLEQAGYLDLDITWADSRVAIYCEVNYMTYAGHEFLDRIRDSKRWATIKSGLRAVKDYSLSAISAIAEGVTSAAITAFLNGQGS